MKQNKKKESFFAKRGFFLTLVVITSLMVITVAMNLILPEEEPVAQLDKEAWNQAVEQSAKNYDDGLTSVYTQEAVAVNNETLPTETTVPEVEPTEANAPTSGKFLLNPVNGSILKDFSSEELQYSETMDDWRVHEGIDFSVEEGSNVIAAADGTVDEVTDDGMMGTSVTISHENGLTTFYANLQEDSTPEKGTAVKAGDPIGKVGRTATLEIIEPSHLHFEVHLGDEIKNPHDYLKDTVTDDE